MERATQPQLQSSQREIVLARAQPITRWREERRPFLPETEQDLRGNFRYVSQRSCWTARGAAQAAFAGVLRAPIVEWVRKYRREDFPLDLWAGVSVAAAAVPMGMSYARLAGVPAAHGLYNVFFHSIVYLVFGSSTHVAVGVSAIESMLAAEAVQAVVGEDPADPSTASAYAEAWLETSITVGFLVGLILLVFRIFRAGVIARFLADPVLSGFATGSAVQIAASQLKDILGVPLHRGSTLSIIREVLAIRRRIQWRCLGVAMASAVAVAGGDAAQHQLFSPVPGSLAALALGAAAAAAGVLPGVPTVGPIRAGLPSPSLFRVNSVQLPQLLLRSLIYATLYFVIHSSVAKVFARQKGESLDTDQELLALGLSGVIGSFFQCFAPATSLSRSSLAMAAGAATPMWMAWAAGAVALAVLWLPPVLAAVPLPTLAAVVVMAVRRMARWREGLGLLRLRSGDSLLWASTVLAVMLGSSACGVAVGVGLSLLWLLAKVAAPRTAVLGRLPGSDFVYRDVTRFPAAVEEPGIKILRFDASLNFANAEVLESAVENLVTPESTSVAPSRSFTSNSLGGMSPTIGRAPGCPHGTQQTGRSSSSSSNCHCGVPKIENEDENKENAAMKRQTTRPDLIIDEDRASVDHEATEQQLEEERTERIRFIIIDASSVNDLDWTALQVLAATARRLKQRNQILLFANWKGPQRDLLERSGFHSVVPAQLCFLSLGAAVNWAARAVRLQRQQQAAKTAGATNHVELQKLLHVNHPAF